MKLLRLYAVCICTTLLSLSRVAAIDLIVAARRLSNFTPEVERLWQQTEQGIFRKDQNGNFERFLRNRFKQPGSIEAMGLILQLQLTVDRMG